jgi:hypothetical protein
MSASVLAFDNWYVKVENTAAPETLYSKTNVSETDAVYAVTSHLYSVVEFTVSKGFTGLPKTFILTG